MLDLEFLRYNTRRRQKAAIFGENAMPRERRKVMKGRYFVAIPFRTDADRQLLDEALAARPDLTAGQVILEALKVYQSAEKNKK
jgi:hypothetical protein